MPTIPAEQLELFAINLLSAGGATAEEANLVGASLVAANLRGYDSHGVMRIPFYLGMLDRGDTVSAAPLDLANETPTHVVADANWGFGRVQCGRLVEMLIERAKSTGVGVGTLIHCSHIGRLGEYCELAADEGLVSIIMVNTHGAARRVAPPGGCEPRLGTNPLGMGVPHKDGHLVLDFSTSATAEGKVRVKRIAGEQCPPGWLLDSSGQPTTDPNSLYDDPPGTILPMGGEQTYKGFGLSLMIDIFAGALSGGLCSRETPQTPKGNCVFVMLADPNHFGGGSYFAREVEQLVDFARSGRRAEGVDEILLPGDPERRVAALKSSQGVELDDENWRQLVDLAERLSVMSP
ncbi:MAG: Ldh family oxidoreductase [Pirellulaceae bacterium]|nr:Ldh family oxidoreductase [Pirellulaceae bacterium]MDP7019492.1 Ldh family oxidoreductase [Pirellulaceae bacterium]